MKRWFQLIALALLFAAPAFAETEQPPFELQDPAATENFRQIYYKVDKLSLLTSLLTYTLDSSTNSFCIDKPAFCVDGTLHKVVVTTITATAQILAPGGSTGSPGFAFSGAPSIGFYQSGSAQFSAVVGGIEIFSLGTSGSSPYAISNGALTAPSATISSVTVSGQVSFNDGNLRSANKGFALGISSFAATGVSSATASSSAFVKTNISSTTALAVSTNRFMLVVSGTAQNDTANDGCDFGWNRDSTFISATNGDQRLRNPSAAVVQQFPISLTKFDAPGDTSSHTYTLMFRAAAGGTCTVNPVITTDTLLNVIQFGQ